MKDATIETYSERVLRALQHIQGHLDESLELDELARAACFSPYHFHRVFRAMAGEPVQEHIRRLRLERAAQRLKLQDRSVTDIAFEAGYESHEAFTRAFHAMFGMAPLQFRAAQAGGAIMPRRIRRRERTTTIRRGIARRIMAARRR